MLGLFLEGAGSIFQVCTLPLLGCSLAFLLAGGSKAGFAAVGFFGGVAALAWVRFADIAAVDMTGGAAVAAGVLLAAAAMVTAFSPSGSTRSAMVSLGSAVGGSVAASVWQPCVGPEFAQVLNHIGSPWSNLGGIVAYVAGIGLLVLGLSLLPVVRPRLTDVADSVAWRAAGAGLGVILAVLLAFGLWADVAENLFVRSTASQDLAAVVEETR